MLVTPPQGGRSTSLRKLSPLHNPATPTVEPAHALLAWSSPLPGILCPPKGQHRLPGEHAGPAIAKFNIPPFSECWAHLYNLCPRPGVSVDVLERYIALIREETVRYVNTLPASVQASIKDRAKGDSLYFGYMRHEIQLPQGKELAAMTLQEVSWEVAINQMQAYGFHARLCCKDLLRPF
ncbi:hypothetical protein QC764_0001250 [Podospora pseudoanserina]|uniref:Uncharacterized protein n=1 Tax=Podospora pseudoanserina TaxID=2609844 RepID=A0ABR0IKF8_9PEZI|nr:hypothetical protein QC764_0001250 [Podospora pseudoanserina]